MIELLALFIVIAAAIWFLGVQLINCSEDISQNTAISTFFIGAIYLSIATSLPELVTSITALLQVHSPTMAMGDLFGSVLFNMMLFSVAIIIYKLNSSLQEINRSNILLTVLLIAVLGIILLFNFFDCNDLTIVHLGIGSIFITGFYFIGFILIHRECKSTTKEKSTGNTSPLWIKFSVLLALLSYLGWEMTLLCEKISLKSNLNHSEVGSTFLAISTSLPEITITFIALRRGLFNLAYGNILGSNIFNCFIIVVLDLLFKKGAILGVLSRGNIQVISASFASIIFMLLGVLGSRSSLDTIKRHSIHLPIACFLVALAGYILLIK